MSFQDYGPEPYPTPQGLGPVAYASLTMDSVGDKIASIVKAPLSGSLIRYGFRCSQRVVADTVNLRVETVASNQPTGTLAGAAPTGSVSVDASNETFEITLATPLTTVADQHYAFVLQCAGAGNLKLSSVTGVRISDGVYTMTYNGAVWSLLPLQAPVGWLVYLVNGVEVYAKTTGMYPWYQIAVSTYNNATGPVNMIGNRFILPAPRRSSGCWTILKQLGTYVVNLYHPDGSLLATTGEISRQQGQSAVVMHDHLWMSAGVPVTVELEADLEYRVLVAPSSTTSIELLRTEIPDALAPDLWAALPGGVSVYRSGRATGGTTFTNVTESRMGVGPTFDGIKDWSDFQLVTVQESIVADWTIYRDDDAVFACVAYAADGVTVQNITGCKIRCTLKYNRDEDADAAAVWQGDTSDGEIVITDAVNGAFTVTIPESATSAFTRQTLLDYDIRIEDATGKEWTAQIGVLTVKTNVTRTMPA